MGKPADWTAGAVKRCTRCAIEKPLTEFSTLAASRDGLAPACRSCASKRNATWRAANQDKIKTNRAAYWAANREMAIASHDAWAKANAEYVKASGAEYRARPENRETAKARSVAWRAVNTAQSRATVKAWRAANPERARAILTAWLEVNPDAKRVYYQNRRARKVASGKLSKGLSAKLLKLQGGSCACCGEPLGFDYHLDHRMPLALGGANTDDNMQLLRATCNLAKHAKHPIEFMQSRGFLL